MFELKTTAKAVIHTTKGSIELEIYAKETPLTSRSFLNSVLNQQYNKLAFSPSSTQITLIKPDISYSIPDEFHSRIKFKRGSVAALRKGKNENSIDGFFIVLNDSPELSGEYVVFGKVVGVESLYTVKKIADGEVDNDGKPVFPVSVVSSDIVSSFFEDLKREEKKREEVQERPVKKSRVVVRYEESDEEEEEFKIKSAHDVLNDKKLSSDVVTSKLEILKNEELQEEVDLEEGEGEHKEEEGEGEGPEEESEESEESQESESDSDSDSDSNSNSEPIHHHIHIQRDPTIDSEYDSNLDLSEAENPISLQTLQNHKFTIIN